MQREALLSLMDRDRRLLSAQDLFTILQSERAEISLATVYRHLTALHAADEVHAVHGHEGEVLYRRCGAEPHHHVRCRVCSRTAEIAARNAQESLSRAAVGLGFAEVEFTIELAGVCADCR